MATRFSSHRRVEPALVERRAEARRPAAHVRVSLSDGEEASSPATLHDISPFGCRLVCVAAPAAGRRATLRLDGGEEIVAEVIWREAGLVGCRFAVPIARTLARRLSLAIQ